MGQQSQVGTDTSNSPVGDSSFEELALTPAAVSTVASADSIPETTELRRGGRQNVWPSTLSMLLGGQPPGSDK